MRVRKHQYERELAKLETEVGFQAVHFGPGHIVFEDSNFHHDHIKWCIERCDSWNNRDHPLSIEPEAMAKIRAMLVWMLPLSMQAEFQKVPA